jgi:tRNA pseudouridine38-40 synthase
VAHKFVPIVGAGRTDAGVHAIGQVISFDLEWQHSADALQKALNANLEEAIVVNAIREASVDFHPRYDAKRRAYRYTILNTALRQPLRRLTCWHVQRLLDVQSMNEAAGSLIGTWDFATFGQPPRGENSVRQVFQAYWEAEPPLLTFTIEANAFLYRMVRSIVGTLKQVGDGSLEVEAFVKAFKSAERKYAGPTAPPQGLVLTNVKYE